jgi:hypothetical protein
MHPTDRKTLFYGIIAGFIVIVLTVMCYTVFKTWLAIIIVMVFFELARQVNKLQKFAQREKRDYAKIQNYPNLICKKHLSRIVLKDMLVYKNIQCRINDECDENDVIHARQLIAVIGKSINQTIGDDYYVNIWDRQEGKVIDGDFDIIEIHKSKEIENYDAIINNVIRYYSNEINRYKPISQVIVSVFGDIELSENTKRLMEKHFLKVEYH